MKILMFSEPFFTMVDLNYIITIYQATIWQYSTRIQR